MSLPKKGSRTVDVGNKTYRYIIKTNYGERLLTIQEDGENPGRSMQIALNNLYITGTGNDGIGPGDVRKVIETLIEKGWNPSSKEHNYVFSEHIEIKR